MASWLPLLCPSVTMAHCLLRSWSDLCPWPGKDGCIRTACTWGQGISSPGKAFSCSACCGGASSPSRYTCLIVALLINEGAKEMKRGLESSGCQQWARLDYRTFLKYMQSPMGASPWWSHPLQLCMTGNRTRGQIKFQRIVHIWAQDTTCTFASRREPRDTALPDL